MHHCINRTKGIPVFTHYAALKGYTHQVCDTRYPFHIPVNRSLSNWLLHMAQTVFLLNKTSFLALHPSRPLNQILLLPPVSYSNLSHCRCSTSTLPPSSYHPVISQTLPLYGSLWSSWHLLDPMGPIFWTHSVTEMTHPEAIKGCRYPDEIVQRMMSSKRNELLREFLTKWLWYWIVLRPWAARVTSPGSKTAGLPPHLLQYPEGM